MIISLTRLFVKTTQSKIFGNEKREVIKLGVDNQSY